MIHVCMAHRLLLALLLLALVACKGATNGKPPVDHPIYEYQPPEEIADAEEEEEEEEETEEEEEGGAEDAQ
jgi:hypothetical protein